MTPEDIVKRQSALASNRSYWEGKWREISDFCSPEGDDLVGCNIGAGGVQTKKQYDDTAATALEEGANWVADEVAPSHAYWHGLTSNKDSGEISDAEKAVVDELKESLFDDRYDTDSGFEDAFAMVVENRLAFNKAFMFLDDGDNRGADRAFQYKFTPLSQLWPEYDDDGVLIGMYRKYSLEASDAVDRYGENGRGGKLSDNIKKDAADPEKRNKTYDFIHAVLKRRDRKEDESDFVGYLVEIGNTEQFALEEKWYEMPWIDFSRPPGSGIWYQRSRAQNVLTSIRALNRMARNQDRAMDQAVDPAYAAHERTDSGINLNGGKVNYGLIDPATGGTLIKPIQNAVDPRFADSSIERHRAKIERAFFVHLITTAVDKEMTRYEAMLREVENGKVLGPVARPIQAGLQRMVERELAIYKRQGKITALMEKYGVEGDADFIPDFDSPWDRAREAQAVQGVMEGAQNLNALAQLTGDPSVMDHLEPDEAAPEILKVTGVPQKMIAGKDSVASKRQARQQQQAAAAQLEASQQAANTQKTAAEAAAIAQQE